MAEEEADVLLLEGGDVVRPVDDPLQDLAHGDDDDDIYIMMQCFFVCNEKSSLPPGSFL